MKKILLMAIFTSLIFSFGYCEEKKQTISLTIKTEKNNYTLGEKISVDAIVENLSDSQPQAISFYPGKNSWKLTRTYKGKTEKFEYHASFPKPLAKEHFLTILPKEKGLLLNGDLAGWINKAGKWQITVEMGFTGYDGKEFALDAFTGSLNAGFINIEVAEKNKQ